MRFSEFQELNARRCREHFHELTTEGTWGISDWCLAIAGEAGELCNALKKVKRGDRTLDEARGDLLEELADVITYCDLAISALGAQTDQVVAGKFDAVSERVGWKGPRALRLLLDSLRAPVTREDLLALAYGRAERG